MTAQTDQDRAAGNGSSEAGSPRPKGAAPFLLTRTRFVVLLAVAAVLLLSMAMFVLSAVLAVAGVAAAARDMLAGELRTADLKIEFFKVVTLVLKAVVFYIIAAGLYGLFIGPWPPLAAVHVDSLADLEKKVINAIIVILATTFLERFTTGGDSEAILREALALAVIVVALVLFQLFLSRDEEAERRRSP